MEEKTAIRKAILEKIAALSMKERKQKSLAITKLLSATKWWEEASLVCTYYSMECEVSTSDLLEKGRNGHKIIAAPRIFGNELIFHDCSNPGVILTRHKYGIQEPEQCTPLIDFRKISGNILMIVPGVAFDYLKNRLGRGKGYYDKFISTLQKINNQAIIKSITSIGICFSEQLIAHVPVTVQDQPVSVVITDECIIE